MRAQKEKSRRQLRMQQLNEASQRQFQGGSSRKLGSARASDKAMQRSRKSSRDMAASRKAVMESGDNLVHNGNGNGNDVNSIKVVPADGTGERAPASQTMRRV